MARASSPVVAVALLVAVTVFAASVVGAAAVAVDPPSDAATVSIALTANAATDRLSLTHRGGPTLDVADVSLTVTVDGDALADQPPVPFFAASGFRSGPSGPFNRGADPRWEAGERTTFRLAATNAPLVDHGDRVTVTVRRGDRLVARANTRAH